LHSVACAKSNESFLDDTAAVLAGSNGGDHTATPSSWRRVDGVEALMQPVVAS